MLGQHALVLHYIDPGLRKFLRRFIVLNSQLEPHDLWQRVHGKDVTYMPWQVLATPKDLDDIYLCVKLT